MDILANTILPIGNPQEYKIHFGVWNGKEQPLDVFVRNPDEWKSWNSYRDGRDDFSRRFIFSVIRYYHEPDKWLFGGIFEVIERNADEHYKIELSNLCSEYIGRLMIHYPGSPGRGRAFYLEKYFDQLKVAQILERPFEGEAFCGYDNVSHSFFQIESIIKHNRLDWKSALENVKGVYLIVDKKNGKMYVGSAYGDSGIWSRWTCYIETGHGWNDELTKIINANGIDYARSNFQFSILEFRSMRTDDNVIRDREQYWKMALLTQAFGYNKN